MVLTLSVALSLMTPCLPFGAKLAPVLDVGRRGLIGCAIDARIFENMPGVVRLASSSSLRLFAESFPASLPRLAMCSAHVLMRDCRASRAGIVAIR